MSRTCTMKAKCRICIELLFTEAIELDADFQPKKEQTRKNKRFHKMCQIEYYRKNKTTKFCSK